MEFGRVWRYFRIAASLWLGACVCVLLVMSMHWKLVGDPGQSVYAISLMDNGMAPYRTVLDTQMPGTYLAYWPVMHTLGTGDLAWRLFDLSLMGISALAMVVIARGRDWFAAVFAIALFVLLHGHGGDEQMGQRDLLVAVLLLVGYAALFVAMRRMIAWPLLLFGFCISAAATIKPPAALFAVALLIALGVWLHKRRMPMARWLMVSVVGMAIPVAISAAFLARTGSTAAFLYMVRNVLPMHAALGRKGPLVLLTISKINPVFAVWLVMAAVVALLRRDRSWENWLLALGVALGCAMYVIQGKGFPYHRYPLLALGMVWMAIQFVQGIRQPGAARSVSVAGIVLGLAIAPWLTLHAIRTPEWGKTYREQLVPDLNALGGPSLSGHVQCIATTGDCDLVLLRMDLVQATGLIEDLLVLNSPESEAVQRARENVWSAMQQNPPRVVIVDPYYFDKHPCDLPAGALAATDRYDGAKYAKLKSWPALDGLLNSDYTLYQDRSWPATNVPCQFSMGYRVYVRK